MRENGMKSLWRTGATTIGAWLCMPSSFSAEVVAHAGYDYVCIDTQHGLIGFETALHMLQAISTTGTTPIVRVPSNEFGIINKMLDAGAMCIIVPMVNTPEEARRAVEACRYHPEGARSYGPTRAAYYAGSDYFRRANAEVACIPMIETQQAVARVDEILSVPGIDAAYVGPADLSITLGERPAPDNGGAFEEARLRIAAACAQHGVVAGIHANSSLVAKHQSAGYRMITVVMDYTVLTAGMAVELQHSREGAGLAPAAVPDQTSGLTA
jgi:4-hydroxy-2-oxoheptanedioate aldolase